MRQCTVTVNATPLWLPTCKLAIKTLHLFMMMMINVMVTVTVMMISRLWQMLVAVNDCDYEQGENEFVHWWFVHWLFWLWVRHASLSFRFPTRKLSSELIQLWLSKAKQEGAKTENDPIVQANILISSRNNKIKKRCM